MVRRCGFALLFLALSVKAYADSPIGTCEPDRGEQYPYLDTVSIQDKGVVLVGRGLIAEMLVYLDGDLVNVTSSHTDELRFPLRAYPGTKVLPADVEIYVQTRDLKRSNICTLKYPGYFSMLLGAASGLSNRDGAPAAMALGFMLRGLIHA